MAQGAIRLSQHLFLCLGLVVLMAMGLSVCCAIVIRKVPYPSKYPAPTGSATCDEAFALLYISCDGFGLSPMCCAWVNVSFRHYPSCYCLFSELNVTTLYYLVGRCRTVTSIPPIVSTCLRYLAPGSSAPPLPLASKSPPPPPPRPKSPPPPPPPRSKSPPPPPPPRSKSAPPPPPPRSKSPPPPPK